MAKELQLGRLMLGVCYYPEQWDESLWADDLRRMREAAARGETAPGGGYQVRVDDLWRDMD